MIDTSKLNIDSRDYLSIYSDLMEAIPSLTQLWNTTDESDAGVVLVKLMSMYGDMLSYNLDRGILEVYPLTVTQRKNASQIFNLIGYKLHWYQSARCLARLSTTSVKSIQIPRYSVFSTNDDSIKYTYIGNQISIDSNNSMDVELIQGYPYTPSLKGNTAIVQSEAMWHSAYNYNLSTNDIVDGDKIYLGSQNVDESSIVLVDDKNEVWQLLKNVNATTSGGKFFELDIDDNDNPYIQLVGYWNNFGVTNFKLFYIVSDGINGQILGGALTRAFDSEISVINSDSTLGYDPETPEEARVNSANYVNTFDTLVTSSDFEKAVRRIEGVANCVVTDKTTDPYPSDMNSNDVNIYITKTEQSDITEDDAYFEEKVLNALRDYKMISLNLNVNFDKIKYYDWQVNGVVYTKEKVSQIEAKSLITQINNYLSNVYNKSNVAYNSVISYLELIEYIKSVSDKILAIDMNGIEYTYKTYDSEGNVESVTVANKEDIIGKYKYVSDLSSATNRLQVTLPNYPIKSGSVVVSIANDTYILHDNKSGKFIIDGGDGIFKSGTIDYQTGEVDIKLTTAMSDFKINYVKNITNMVVYNKIDVDKFYIADECIRYE